MKVAFLLAGVLAGLAAPASAGPSAQTSKTLNCYFVDVKLSGALLHECRTQLASKADKTITIGAGCNSPQAFQATGPRYRSSGIRFRLYDYQQDPLKSRFRLNDEGGGKKMRVVGRTKYESFTVRNKSKFTVKFRFQAKCPQ